MREIGVRELRAKLSETLRAVERGEQVRVTVRGKAVAEIVPASGGPADRRIRELIADGRLTAPASPLPRAPRLRKARRSASGIVLSDRDAER